MLLSAEKNGFVLYGMLICALVLGCETENDRFDVSANLARPGRSNGGQGYNPDSERDLENDDEDDPSWENDDRDTGEDIREDASRDFDNGDEDEWTDSDSGDSPPVEIDDPVDTDTFVDTGDEPEPDGQGEEETCLRGGGSNFFAKGPYTYKTVKKGSYTFYLPTNLEGCKAPVIAFAMGTGAPAMSYTHWYTHFASYGFVVVVDPNTMAASGASLKKGIDAVYTSHGDMLDPNAGTTGHSQGGAGAFAARSHPRVKTIVGIEPGQFPSSGDNNVNYLGLAGTADMFGVGTDPMLFHYSQVTGPKFYAKLQGADHIASVCTPSQKAFQFRAISTAWFRCFLAGESSACELFAPRNCSNFEGTWAKCEGKNL